MTATLEDNAILAKSLAQGNAVSLLTHSRDVLRAARAMFGEPGRSTRLAQEWLSFFGLPIDAFESFWRNLAIAAILHDVGKANDGYQLAVRKAGEQVMRHEHLSALLLWMDPLQEWLRNQERWRVDAEIVASAIVSHHLKVNDRTFAQWLNESERVSVRVLTNASDLQATLELSIALGADPPPSLRGIPVGWNRNSIVASKGRFERAMYQFSRALRRDEGRLRHLLAVKAALIAVDSAGSAIRRTGQDLEGWLAAAFDRPPLTAEDIERAVIAPRVRELAAQGRWFGFHDFQLAIADLGSRALLLSGCGSGKTLAAWKWIAAQLQARPRSRVIFLYPTRGTATEGFRDYVSWAGPELAALLHGTAQYDLEGMFRNPDDARFGHDYTERERMFALGYWHRRIFSATVDSFLAIMSNHYAAICMAPLLADSVIVFDEVHSFDSRMFRALERYLTFFKGPVLSMTASLPADRISALHQTCGLALSPREPEEFPDLRHQAQAPRYRLRFITESQAGEVAETAARRQQKVLWVVNTVARCQAAVRWLTDRLGDASILCYHSRFRLRDRRSRHEDVISRFRTESSGPLVLVSTQVCEMSLDLDADVLITEAAGVPALIQRMGRCCRTPLPIAGRLGEVCIYDPPDSRPYEPSEIKAGVAFAQGLAKKDWVTHADLAEYLARLEVSDPFATGGFTGFLDSGWYAMAQDDTFRDADDRTIDCVLDTDLIAYLRARAARADESAGFIVPVPRRRFLQSDPRLGPHLKLAPATCYDPKLGFLDAEVQPHAGND